MAHVICWQTIVNPAQNIFKLILILNLILNNEIIIF